MTSDWTPQQPARPDPRRPGERAQRIRASRLWAGGVATAFVAALIAVVGIVIARGIFGVAVLAPTQSGAWGDVRTGIYAFVAFGFGLLATALMHLLLVSTPSPFAFFGWIIGLCTLAAVLVPFAIDAGLASKVSTAIINGRSGSACGR